MFREYAVDPAVLANWERVRFLMDSFGPWRGRFLAEYPREWRRMVFEGLRCPDVEKKRIVERLANIDRRVFFRRKGTTYDRRKTWLENAESEHRRLAFHAIVSTASSGEHILDATEIDDRCERWRLEPGALVRRDGPSFVSALELLLQASTRVVIVDPYFRADQSQKTDPLVAFCRFMLRTSATIEVHFAEERSYAQSMRDAERALPAILPGGARVTLRCWRQKPGGPRLHNRYVLTDVAGVQFGDGIELGDAGQQDRISILDESSWRALWAQYTGQTPGFETVGDARQFAGDLAK